MSKLKLFIKFTLFFQLVVALSACGNFYEITPVAITGQRLSEDLSRELILKLREHSAALKSLKALARVEVVYRDRNSSLRYGFLVQRPDLLRIEGLPLNGSYSLSVLTGYAGKLQLVDHTNKTVTLADLNRDSLEALLQIPAEPTELIDYLLGAVPLMNTHYELSELRAYLDQDKSQYHLLDPKTGDYWQLAGSDRRLKRAQFRRGAGAEPYLELAYNYHPDGKVKAIEFVIPDKDLKIKILYQVLVENQEIRETLFESQIPAAYSLQVLEIKSPQK